MNISIFLFILLIFYIRHLCFVLCLMLLINYDEHMTTGPGAWVSVPIRHDSPDVCNRTRTTPIEISARSLLPTTNLTSVMIWNPLQQMYNKYGWSGEIHPLPHSGTGLAYKRPVTRWSCTSFLEGIDYRRGRYHFSLQTCHQTRTLHHRLEPVYTFISGAFSPLNQQWACLSHCSVYYWPWFFNGLRLYQPKRSKLLLKYSRISWCHINLIFNLLIIIVICLFNSGFVFLIKINFADFLCLRWGLKVPWICDILSQKFVHVNHSNERICNQIPSADGSMIAVCCSGYAGDNCEHEVCESPCQNGGRCIGPNICDCSGTNFGGPTCIDPTGKVMGGSLPGEGYAFHLPLVLQPSVTCHVNMGDVWGKPVHVTQDGTVKTAALVSASTVHAFPASNVYNDSEIY